MMPYTIHPRRSENPLPQPPADPTPDVKPARRLPILIPLLVATAFFMEQLDSTIITTAVPAIARNLAVTPVQMSLAVAAYVLAGFSNFFLRRTFVSDAVLGSVVLITLAAFLVFQFTQQMQSLGTVAHVNWNLLPAGVLILFALWILAAVALACSTRFDTIPTLAICSAIFLIGLMSDYFFGRPAEHGSWWASALYSVIPNWQLFWLADAIDMGKSTFQWGYVAKAFAYTVGYAGAALAIGTALFEERELS